MSRGVVIFGINNTKIDYIQLAIMCAAFVKKNLGDVQIALITNEDLTSDSYHYQWRLGDFFNYIIKLPEEDHARFDNMRTYRDTRYHTVNAHFKNESRSSVYDLSPFDETLLIDSDYLVCSDALNAVWGNEEEVMINCDATTLLHTPVKGDEYRLNQYGIRMYWATVVYFKRGGQAKALFDLVEFIRDNWPYYSMLYELPGNLFRNDYAFSIAIHILNGFTPNIGAVAPLPYKSLMTSFDMDQFYSINSTNSLTIFANDPKETWKFYASRLKEIDVHCMNKLSLLNKMDDIMDMLTTEQILVEEAA